MNGITDVDNGINELNISYIYSENGVINTVEGKENGSLNQKLITMG